MSNIPAVDAPLWIARVLAHRRQSPGSLPPLAALHIHQGNLARALLDSPWDQVEAHALLLAVQAARVTLDPIESGVPFCSTSQKEHNDHRFRFEVLAELNRARTKFPRPEGVFTALVEEVGELVEAAVLPDVFTPSEVWMEAVQVVSTAIRLIQETDPCLTALRAQRAA